MIFLLTYVIQVAVATKDLRKKYKINIPFPELNSVRDVKYRLAYQKPATFDVVGSYASKTLINTAEDTALDFAVTMPLVRDCGPAHEAQKLTRSGYVSTQRLQELPILPQKSTLSCMCGRCLAKRGGLQLQAHL